jgi:hypothetical protein
MHFCELEKDQKTFMYFKKYIELVKQDDNDPSVLDNQFQISEIYEHLRLNGYSYNDSQEIHNWIKKNGKPFRNYLNTIKIVYLVWHCMEKDWEDITWEEFCKLEDKINEVKKICLDKIF